MCFIRWGGGGFAMYLDIWKKMPTPYEKKKKKKNCSDFFLHFYKAQNHARRRFMALSERLETFKHTKSRFEILIILFFSKQNKHFENFEIFQRIKISKRDFVCLKVSNRSESVINRFLAIGVK